MIDTQYEDMLRHVLENGQMRGDRTGTGTISSFVDQLRYNLADGFPLITTKRVAFKTMTTELIWMLRGRTDVGWLQDRNCHIWDEWADENGQLGPVYGRQWRAWGDGRGNYIDQISSVLETIKSNPESRRLIVSAWNVAEIDKMALPPCHMIFQFYVSNDKLSCHIYQRSADLFLGVPFNIASYALLTHLMAAQTGLGVGELIWTGGDCHIYANHVEQVGEQLSREPYRFPRLEIAPRDSLFEYEPEDLSVVGYRHHPGISAPVAV